MVYNEEKEYHSTFRYMKHRTARKSTTSVQPSTQTCATETKSDYSMTNFKSETSVQKKRKCNRNIDTPKKIRKPIGALYDENGVHITTLTNLCECLNENCLGCFFECPKCGSQKCGIECRVYRKYIVDQIEYQGYDKDAVIKNPLFKD